ncbi:substrate-binding periplasmic protein [Vibrio ostreicida]|nr:transporter substrate-binding domain-containing protein [Vibrio ostreicida]NPD08360.1 transporter substrate-binding domain-containing protein [Vibrio ostreicida]
MMLRPLSLFFLLFFSFVSNAELPPSDPWFELTFITEEYHPLNFIDSSGQLTGLSVEVLLGAAKHANSQLSRIDIQVIPWARGYKYALNNKGSVLFATSRKPERESLFLWVGPISQGTPSFLIARKERNITIQKRADLSQYRIGVVRGDSLEKRLEKLNIPDKNIVRIHSKALLARQLDKGRIDLWASNWTGAQAQFSDLDLDVNSFERVYTFQYNDNYFSLNRETPRQLVQEMQSALDSFKKTTEYQQILNQFK